MPPRIPPSSASLPIHRVQALRINNHDVRHFSQSSALKMSEAKQRKIREAKDEFMKWITTEGKRYQRPTGSPNYLVSEKEKRSQGSQRNKKTKGGDRFGTEGDDLESGLATQTEKDDAKNFTQRPFPLNLFFKSKSVLSENFKEAIYERVVVKGDTVLAASAFFNVSVERVAAVVRMKQMERDWLKQVRFYFSLSARHMMRTPFQNSISLEDHSMVTCKHTLNSHPLS